MRRFGKTHGRLQLRGQLDSQRDNNIQDIEVYITKHGTYREPGNAEARMKHRNESHHVGVSEKMGKRNALSGRETSQSKWNTALVGCSPPERSDRRSQHQSTCALHTEGSLPQTL
jgi:hypothetical protein